MITPMVTGVSALPNGRFLVRIVCPWCGRKHDHAILIGREAFQPPPCGTPSSYRVHVPSWATEYDFERTTA